MELIMEQEKLLMIKHFQKIVPLNDEICEKIVSHFHSLDFRKKEYLLKENQVSNYYFYLLEGCIRSYVHDIDGNEITTNLYTNNSFVFEVSSFFKRIPSIENIQTLCNCKTLAISFEDLNKLFHSIPEFRELGRAILVNAFISHKERSMSLICQTAEMRYENLIKNRPDIFLHTPLKYIASYLAITDTSLSRIRKEFIKKD